MVWLNIFSSARYRKLVPTSHRFTPFVTCCTVPSCLLPTPPPALDASVVFGIKKWNSTVLIFCLDLRQSPFYPDFSLGCDASRGLVVVERKLNDYVRLIWVIYF